MFLKEMIVSFKLEATRDIKQNRIDKILNSSNNYPASSIGLNVMHPVVYR
jgi:hypothetical protein